MVKEIKDKSINRYNTLTIAQRTESGSKRYTDKEEVEESRRPIFIEELISQTRASEDAVESRTALNRLKNSFLPNSPF